MIFGPTGDVLLTTSDVLLTSYTVYTSKTCQKNMRFKLLIEHAGASSRNIKDFSRNIKEIFKEFEYQKFSVKIGKK